MTSADRAAIDRAADDIAARLPPLTHAQAEELRRTMNRPQARERAA